MMCNMSNARMYALHTKVEKQRRLTRTNGSTLTESKTKEGPQDSMDLSTLRGVDCTIHCVRYSSIPHGVLSPLPNVRRSTCSFKLACSSAGFAVLSHPRSRLRQFVPDPFLAPRPDPTKQRPRRVTPPESARLLCCVNPSRSSGHEFVQRCVLLNSGCLFVSK